jgi:hypothetical protein
MAAGKSCRPAGTRGKKRGHVDARPKFREETPKKRYGTRDLGETPYAALHNIAFLPRNSTEISYSRFFNGLRPTDRKGRATRAPVHIALHKDAGRCPSSAH